MYMYLYIYICICICIYTLGLSLPTPLQAGGLDSSSTFIPPLLAVGAVHHHLIKVGLRMRASIVVETAQVQTHAFSL